MLKLKRKRRACGETCYRISNAQKIWANTGRTIRIRGWRPIAGQTKTWKVGRGVSAITIIGVTNVTTCWSLRLSCRLAYFRRPRRRSPNLCSWPESAASSTICSCPACQKIWSCSACPSIRRFRPQIWKWKLNLRIFTNNWPSPSVLRKAPQLSRKNVSSYATHPAQNLSKILY